MYVPETGNAVSLWYVSHNTCETSKKKRIQTRGCHGYPSSPRTTTISFNAIPLMERCHCPLPSKWTAGATSLLQHQPGHCEHAIDRSYWQPLSAPLSAVAAQVTKAGNTPRHGGMLMNFVNTFILTNVLFMKEDLRIWVAETQNKISTVLKQNLDRKSKVLSCPWHEDL
jgi:hypothetical protein